MVEFGLKLEDNKVAEWREHYIQYEKLKQILKRAAAAAARYRDLEARNPTEAAQIRRDFYQGLPTPAASTDNLQSVVVVSDSSRSAQQQQPQQRLDQIRELRSSATEESSTSAGIEVTPPKEEQQQRKLASSSSSQPPDYGATTSGMSSALPSSDTEALLSLSQQQQQQQQQQNKIHKSNSASDVISKALERAASGVSDYFKKSYQRQVRDALQELEKHSQEFGVTLQANIELVNDFYNRQLREFDERIALLKESVSQSTKKFRPSPETPPSPPLRRRRRQADDVVMDENVDDDEEAYLETPLISRKANKMDMLAHAIARRFHRTATVGEGQPLLLVPHHHHHDKHTSEFALPAGEDDDDDDVAGSFASTKDRDSDNDNERQFQKEVQSIQRALVDLYRRVKLLHNFAIMNYTGFVKIVKKHDKTLPAEKKNQYQQAIRSKNICDEAKSVETMANYVERLYANWFCDRNMNEARAQLLPKRGDGLQMDWSQLRLGYRLGMCSILVVWVCWDCIWGLIGHGNTTIGARNAFPVFRACGGLLLLEWFWGCSVFVWTRYRVNYIFIMDLDPSIVESPLAIFNEAVDDTLIFLLGMLLYYKAGAHEIPGHVAAGIYPGMLVTYTIYRLLFPLRTRLPMWQSIFNVITAPMHSPNFFHSYVGDIFTSMVKVFQDIAWTIFFFLSGDWLISEDSKHANRHPWSKTTWYSKVLIPLLTLLPLWFRFNQCLRRYMDTNKRFPHLANAFKYALSQTVTLFGAFHPLYLANTGGSNMFQIFWTFCFVASSLYSFVWDVYMDWGLGLPKYQFLGPRLMYPNRSSYYAVIALDLVLRFAWVLTLVPPDSGADFALPAYLTMVSMMLELFRRTVWGFLRLENEHRSNTAGYRRVDFVPLHFTTGHTHEYKQEKQHRGVSVLLEVAFVTLVVLGVSVASVVAAQQATERSSIEL